MKYYKATDGKITVFRSSKERDYGSASTKSPAGNHAISFSRFPPSADRYPTVEITKAEYDTLVDLKISEDRNRKRSRSRGPQDSWVPNSML
jgi:hypothetical protein